METILKKDIGEKTLTATVFERGDTEDNSGWLREAKVELCVSVKAVVRNVKGEVSESDAELMAAAMGRQCFNRAISAGVKNWTDWSSIAEKSLEEESNGRFSVNGYRCQVSEEIEWGERGDESGEVRLADGTAIADFQYVCRAAEHDCLDSNIAQAGYQTVVQTQNPVLGHVRLSEEALHKVADELWEHYQTRPRERFPFEQMSREQFEDYVGERVF